MRNEGKFFICKLKIINIRICNVYIVYDNINFRVILLFSWNNFGFIYIYFGGLDVKGGCYLGIIRIFFFIL